MNLINSLNNSIDIEYDSKNDEIDELMQIPIDQRVQKGDSIIDITADFEIYNKENMYQNIKIYFTNNYSKFVEGSRVLLTGYGQSIEMEVLEDNINYMVLTCMPYIYTLETIDLNNKDGWQLDSTKVDVRNILKKSTEILKHNPLIHDFINGIIDGKVIPQITKSKFNIGLDLIYNSNLNQNQKEAFANAYSADNYYLIQGPPGTGKTQLLAFLAAQFAKEGLKVLITATTHSAINNALQKIYDLNEYEHIVKVGKKHQNGNLEINYPKIKSVVHFYKSGYSNNSKGIIVGATCFSIHTRKLEFMDWDIIIFDEAGQLNISLAIAAMVKGKKFIFIGDHKQLPPIISKNQVEIMFTKSIFEHLLSFSSGIMLNITYRMNEKINTFPSKHFYNNELLADHSIANLNINLDNNFNEFQEILDINKHEVLCIHNEPNEINSSDFESLQIFKFVTEYLNKGILPRDIAILTPFRAQVRKIKNILSNLKNYEIFKEDLFIDTIERFQGQERDIVMISMAISNPILSNQRLDFFYNPNRLNVALTRSKKKRIVLASETIFNIKTNDQNIKNLLEIYNNFYNESTKIEI